jgi:hypothetical protein
MGTCRDLKSLVRHVSCLDLLYIGASVIDPLDGLIAVAVCTTYDDVRVGGLCSVS